MEFVIIFLVAIASNFSEPSDKQKAVEAYYRGFESHDWNKVVHELNDNFTFTSPNNDDHITLDQFKAKCWPTNKYVKKVELTKMTEAGNEVILQVTIYTTDDKVVRNVDVFSFDGGKIKSIEVFFGLGKGFPGSDK